MSRSKLDKFAMNRDSANVIEPGKPLFESVKGNWNREVFKNDRDIVVELACGRGEYTVGLATHIRDKNFVGVDIKGARIWKGSQEAIQNGLEHAVFLRTHISLLENFFEPGEISEIWIIFPDPRPKGSDERRRLTCLRYLHLYKKLLKPGGTVHLKTDNTGLFAYTLEVLEQEKMPVLAATDDLYNSDLLDRHFGIQTWYEKLFLEEGSTIKYVEFRV